MMDGKAGTGKTMHLLIDPQMDFMIPDGPLWIGKKDPTEPACLGLYIEWVIRPGLEGGKKDAASLARELLVVCGPIHYHMPWHIEILDFSDSVGIHFEPTRVVDHEAVVVGAAVENITRMFEILGSSSKSFPPPIGTMTHSLEFGESIATCELPHSLRDEEPDRSWVQLADHFNPRGRRKRPK